MTTSNVSSNRRVLEVMLVLLLLVGLAAMLLSSLSATRKAELQSEISRYDRPTREGLEGSSSYLGGLWAGHVDNQNDVSPATVRSFAADITLTPTLSVGTADPESIYEVDLHATIQAVAPEGADVCEVVLPLPPRLISLAGLNVTVDGEPSDSVGVNKQNLLWWGRLPHDEPATLDLAYSAVGQGIYELAPPQGHIVDEFHTTLTAKGSDVKMLALSLQPQQHQRQRGDTTFVWQYERLMLGRPIRLDVLGVAPIDRLGALTSLGPVSVAIYGVLATLIVLAFRPASLDKWLMLMIIGAFTSAYPLMYFAQEFVSLETAILASAALVLLVIAIRAATLFGAALGLAGLTLSAAAIMAGTLAATVRPQYQGLILTLMIVGSFLLAMMLIPRAQRLIREQQPTPPPLPTDPAEHPAGA